MALSPKHFTFLLFLSLLSSHLGHARDAQFFSKVTPTTTTNNAKETIEVPKKEQEQEPSFTPDTQNGYGLYGHESGQFPPTTTRTTTSLPYTATTTTTNNNNNYYNKEAYVSDPQGMSDTRFVDKAYTTPTNNNDNNYYNGAKNYYNTQQQPNNYYNTQQQPNNYYNTQKQGMSDTRFLENGKYYYDGHANRYNNKGYYGNFNENSYEQYQNSMEGYQQQNQEEFQEREEEYVP